MFLIIIPLSRGLYLEACDNNTLRSNRTSVQKLEGVFLDAGSDNLLIDNNASYNSKGIRVYGIDVAGHLNSTAVNFTVDIRPPVLSVFSQEEGWTYSADSIQCFVSADEDIKIWGYELDKNGAGIFNISNRRMAETSLSGLSNGNRVVEIWVYGKDLVGNLNSTACSFTVDTKTPLISIISPKEGPAMKLTVLPVMLSLAWKRGPTSFVISAAGWAARSHQIRLVSRCLRIP